MAVWQVHLEDCTAAACGARAFGFRWGGDDGGLHADGDTSQRAFRGSAVGLIFKVGEATTRLQNEVAATP